MAQDSSPEPTGLYTPTPNHDSRVADHAQTPGIESAGVRVGPYKLVRSIGEGGMGSVWLAEQLEPIRRNVALKIIKAGMDSAQVTARFDAERQALAMMDHANIARVYDGGSTDIGRPFFVMEFVDGTPITKFCDEHRLDPRQRLELFNQVCLAIQHAHQKGIIHRDIKPSNVLVARADNRSAVKVIDFGIAKATGQQLTERTLVTEFGAVVGTLEYMSPEQAGLNDLDIDTRSDIYSMGVLLYELLTGTTPLNRQSLPRKGFAELLRLIREEEPPKPSTRLNSSTETLVNISVARRTEPSRLTKLVRGDLDWIVMKAIDKDRTRRYDSANALARDIERYLNHEPVEACPPSAGYRLGKFVRRHRTAVVGAAACLLILGAGIAGSTWQAIRATAAESQMSAAKKQSDADRDRAISAEQAASERLADAIQQKERAEKAEKKTAEKAVTITAMNDYLLHDLLDQASTANQPFLGAQVERNPNVTVAELLDRAAKAIAGKFTGQPDTEATIRMTLGNTYSGLGKFAPAQEQLERAVAIRTAHYGPTHPETLVCKHNLAQVYSLSGKSDQATALYDELLASKDGTGPADPLGMMAAKNNLALLCLRKGDLRRAESLFKEVLGELLGKVGGKDSRTLTCRSNLVMVYHGQKRFNEALAELKDVVALLEATQGVDHPNTLSSKNNLAVLYRVLGKLDEAEGLYKEVIGNQEKVLDVDHPQTLGTKFNLANLYEIRRQLDRALPLFEEVAVGSRRKLGPANADTQQRVYKWASCLERMGKGDVAEPIYREMVDLMKKAGDQPQYLAWNEGLAANLLGRKKSAEAEPVIRVILDIRGSKEPEAWTTFHLKSMLGGALSDQKKYTEAEPLLLAGYDGLKKHAAEIPPGAQTRITEALQRLVQLYESWGKRDEAARWKEGLKMNGR
jgi:non-specific serine/threonine protein kinase/serine/threonine-protein kinase